MRKSNSDPEFRSSLCEQQIQIKHQTNSKKNLEKTQIEDEKLFQATATYRAQMTSKELGTNKKIRARIFVATLYILEF